MMIKAINLNLLIMIIAIAVVLVAVLAIVVVLIIKQNGKKTPKIKIDDKFIEDLLRAYGGIDNISSTALDNGSGRLRVSVKTLDLCNLDELKGFSTKGVFVTNNVIVTLFKYDSKRIKEEIDKRL